MNPKQIYNTTITCPICDQQFSGTKVRLGSYRITGKDSDFSLNYQGINPILYEVFVCEHCGYAALQDRFAKINPKDKTVIATNVYSHWKPKSYSGERTLDTALDAFKLALYALELRKAKNSEIAKICLRIAWIYRWKGDSREMEFLQFALDHYCAAYQTENLPFDKLDEPHCTYLIAELYRRVGNPEEATKWFGRLFNSAAARQYQALWTLAHDQYQLVKEAQEQQE